MPSTTTLYGEVKIGSWISTQRAYKKKNKLTPEQITKLEQIDNWYWVSDIVSWDETYKILQEYVDEFKQLPSTTTSHG